MTREEINNLFKKYNVSIPKDKHGQSECKKCKEEHKYSLTWTSFLYEYKEHYYCYQHIVNILLEKENKQLKEDMKVLFNENNAKEKVIIKQKNNWNKLKKHCNIMLSIFEKMDEQTKQEQLDKYAIYGKFLYKMKELEKGSDINEKNKN